MARISLCSVAPFLAAILLFAQSAAAEPPPDRSALSYAENVTINTVCYDASQQGTSAYEKCVRAQLAALAIHPSPDRSGLSARRNREVEEVCEHEHHTDIGQYNDCLKKAIAALIAAPDGAGSPATGAAAVFANAPDPAAQGEATPAALPLASAILPKRPDGIGHKPLSPAEVFKKVQVSVYIVLATPSEAEARARNIALGSAVAVSDHLLLTNCHVVQGRPLIRILHDKDAYLASLAAANPPADRCILKSEGPPLAPIAGVRPYADLVVGERVFTVGTPMGLDRTLSEGIVSGLRNAGGYNIVQTDAAISHGNSGGGLFDESGNLIGITTFTFAVKSGYQNLNFAIAASDYWR